MPEITVAVNRTTHTVEVPDNMLLSTLLRDVLRLTGTHIGCDTSQCGACTVHLDGRSVKACAVLAASCEGAEVVTIEGLANGTTLHPMQEAFREHHALQCGFCTPGMIMAGVDIVNRHGGKVDEATIRKELEGNLCRCTGYHNIVRAIESGAAAMAGTKIAAE